MLEGAPEIYKKSALARPELSRSAAVVESRLPVPGPNLAVAGDLAPSDFDRVGQPDTKKPAGCWPRRFIATKKWNLQSS
jgi:hypothetical protein